MPSANFIEIESDPMFGAYLQIRRDLGAQEALRELLKLVMKRLERRAKARMPPSGRERRWCFLKLRSTLPQITDYAEDECRVREVPNPDTPREAVSVHR